jgi:hypothetical protein
MTLIEVKTADLTGAALDWAVAECLKPSIKHPERFSIGTFGPLFSRGYKYPCWAGRKYAPSADWKEGGPIIEREFLDVWRNGFEWVSRLGRQSEALFRGPTPLIAAMRCYVASKKGDVVMVPAELTNQPKEN